MLFHLKDHVVDWIGVGQRRKIVMIFLAINLLLAPFWITLGLYFSIRHGVMGEDQLTLWTPVFLGMVGCFFLPTKRLSTRAMIAIAYVPVTAVLLVGFSITVGCLMIGSCL